MCGRDFCNGAPCGRLTYFCAKYLGDLGDWPTGKGGGAALNFPTPNGGEFSKGNF